MKQMKKTGIFKAANVTFDPSTKAAFSYDWWQFVKVIKGRVIFNNCRYSISTQKHQRKVRAVLAQLGIEVSEFVKTRRSLSEFSTLKEVRAAHEQYERDEAANDELKRRERNAKAAKRRLEARVAATVARVPQILDHAAELMDQINASNA